RANPARLLHAERAALEAGEAAGCHQGHDQSRRPESEPAEGGPLDRGRARVVAEEELDCGRTVDREPAGEVAERVPTRGRTEQPVNRSGDVDVGRLNVAQPDPRRRRRSRPPVRCRRAQFRAAEPEGGDDRLVRAAGEAVEGESPVPSDSDRERVVLWSVPRRICLVDRTGGHPTCPAPPDVSEAREQTLGVLGATHGGGGRPGPPGPGGGGGGGPGHSPPPTRARASPSPTGSTRQRRVPALRPPRRSTRPRSGRSTASRRRTPAR